MLTLVGSHGDAPRPQEGVPLPEVGHAIRSSPLREAHKDLILTAFLSRMAIPAVLDLALLVHSLCLYFDPVIIHG